MTSTPFYRCRWVIRLREPVTLPPWQHGVITGLVKSANSGRGTEAPTGHPPNLCVAAPEVGRTAVAAGETFAFGASVVAPTAAEASRTVHRVTRGIDRLGRQGRDRPAILGGNFDLVALDDTVAGRSLGPEEPLAAIPVALIADEIDRCRAAAGSLTLVFPVPLNMLLPGEKHRRGAKRHADRNAFVADQFLNDAARRLRDLGLAAGRPPGTFPEGAMTILANDLEWLSIRYGAEQKTRAGAVGSLTVAVADPATLETLVWGQYVPLGHNTHFGLGRYRIHEAGADTTACGRTCTLLDIALAPAALASAAAAAQLPAEEVCTAAARLQTGSYVPQPPSRIAIRDPDGAPRDLLVPSALDRTLQRLLAATLTPAFERLFEDSSFAWRRRLSRGSAAAAIASHAAEGWLFALRADIDRFFPSVPRPRLAARLAAWVGNDPIAAAALVLLGEEPGLPTGAPLSPLLGNLFLDEFDEQVASRGGRLVRFADDFLVLCRSRAAAEEMHAGIRHLVEQLQLRLNDDACVIDLRDGFRFLGYDFTWDERYRWDGPGGPIRTGDLGWRDGDRVPALASLPLAGEEAAASWRGVVVIGPGPTTIDVNDGVLVVAAPGGDRRIPLAGVDVLVQIGSPAWSSAVAPRLLAEGVRTCLVSAGGWPIGALDSSPPDDPAAIRAQVTASADPRRILAIARSLVRAKLLNTATLARALEGPGSGVALELTNAAEKLADQADIAALRGVEGAAARSWYRLFARSLGKEFHFPGRVAPAAADPVNVMLNIGYTMLHRHLIAAIRTAGLSPSIGFLHVPSPRFAALAADLQEPFRHLVDRAVLLATRRLAPKHFIASDHGEHPLILQPLASKTFHVILQRSLQACVRADGHTDARPWVAQFLHAARSLRRHLVDPAAPWRPFEHANPGSRDRDTETVVEPGRGP